MEREGRLFGKKQGSNRPFFKNESVKNERSRREFPKENNNNNNSNAVDVDVQKCERFDTLSFNFALYQSAIASRRNKEIESYRR